MYQKYFKRLIDLFIAIVVLAVLAPVFFIIVIALLLLDGGSPFFIQRRPGMNKKIFSLIKFKSMNNNKDKYGYLLSDKDRITPFGRFLRSSSFDELPQLINVIKGDMSLIGPRPLLIKYLPLYNTEQARRHEVRPGITGWTQVTGRNNLTWEEKFKRDVWYVDNMSFALDMKILWLTLIKVFKREGINQAGEATMKPFTGNENNK